MTLGRVVSERTSDIKPIPNQYGEHDDPLQQPSRVACLAWPPIYPFTQERILFCEMGLVPLPITTISTGTEQANPITIEQEMAHTGASITPIQKQGDSGIANNSLDCQIFTDHLMTFRRFLLHCHLVFLWLSVSLHHTFTSMEDQN